MLRESDIFFLKAHFKMNQRKSPARLSESSAFHPPLRWLSWNKSKGCFSKFPTGLSDNSIFFCRVDGWEAEQTKPKKISGPIQSDRVVDHVTSHSFQPKPVKSLQKHWREVKYGCQLFHMLCLSVCCVTAGENRGQSLSQRSQITLQGKVCPKYPKLRSRQSSVERCASQSLIVNNSLCKDQRHLINAAEVFMFSQSLCFYLLCQSTLSVFLFSAITCLLCFCLYLGANHRLKKEVVVKQHAVKMFATRWVYCIKLYQQKYSGKPLLIVQGSRTFRHWPQLLQDLLHRPLTSLMSVWCRNAAAAAPNCAVVECNNHQNKYNRIQHYILAFILH